MSRWPTELVRRATGMPWQAARLWQPARTVFVEPSAVWSAPAVRDGDRSPPARHDDLRAWCRAHPGSRARLVLSGTLSFQVIAPGAGAAFDDAQTLSTWARHQFVQYHGSEAERWPIATWTAAGQGSAGATALHGVDLSMSATMAQAHGVSLVAAQPWWAVALRIVARQRPELATRSSAVLVLVERSVITWLQCSRGGLVDLQQRWLDTSDPRGLTGFLSTLPVDLSAGALRLVLGHGCSDDAAALQGLQQRGWTPLSPLVSASPPWRWIEA